MADDAWLRVMVQEPRRAGLADEVRELFGERVVDVRMDDPTPQRKQRVARKGRVPTELFDEFLTERNIADERVRAMFAELLDAQLESASGLASESPS